MPTTACSAAMDTGRAPPAEVKPGHMMLAPLSTKRMAPLSTCMRFIMLGSGEEEGERVCVVSGERGSAT